MYPGSKILQIFITMVDTKCFYTNYLNETIGLTDILILKWHFSWSFCLYVSIFYIFLMWLKLKRATTELTSVTANILTNLKSLYCYEFIHQKQNADTIILQSELIGTTVYGK